jgi:CheY-like chemotaxis protein
VKQHVLAAVDDMFFASKIRATAEHLGLEVRFARSAKAVIEAAREEKPSLVIVDLHSQRCDPLLLAEALKADEHLRALPLIGFFSHVETELQRQAERAGYDRVLPRSAFTKQLPEILQSKI